MAFYVIFYFIYINFSTQFNRNRRDRFIRIVNTARDNIIEITQRCIDDADKTVTSISAELGREIDINEVKNHAKRHFSNVFGFKFL